MFSPMVAMRWVSSSSTLRPDATVFFLIASTSPPASIASSATVRTKAWNCSLRETKSVSAFTSTTAADPGAAAMPTSPSLATRPAFFAAAARPFFRSQSMAGSISPPVSIRAFLQSIIPAPVFSRRSLTSEALICVISTPSLTIVAVSREPPAAAGAVELRP